MKLEEVLHDTYKQITFRIFVLSTTRYYNKPDSDGIYLKN